MNARSGGAELTQEMFWVRSRRPGISFRKSQLEHRELITVGQPFSKQNLFREATLAKIRPPEQLDALLPITSPLGWLALFTTADRFGRTHFLGFFRHDHAHRDRLRHCRP